MKKFFLILCLGFSLCFAQFDAMIQSTKDEEVLQAFDVEPDFLNNENFILVKNSFFSEIRKDYMLAQFKENDELIPTLKGMLLKEGIPQEFLYLAMIESEFSLSAKSRKKAVGLWQFIPSTAKVFGLRMDSQIDERKDPIKSTKAAITYLKSLKEKFGKWYLAAIAYNCGSGRVTKAIEEAGSDSLSVLLDPEAKYVPLESRMYIRKILAVSLLFHSVDTLKTKDYDYFLNRGANSLLTSIEVSAKTPLSQVASQAGLSLAELKRYNPQFKRNITPTYAQTPVYLPYKFLAQYKERNGDKPLSTQSTAIKTAAKNTKTNISTKSNAKSSKTKSKSYLVHKVGKGDTIYSISKRYGISTKRIKQYNALKNANSLSINQEILIPLDKDKA